MTITQPSPTWTDLFPRPGEWTEADYWPVSERGRIIELSDGNVEVSPMPTYLHQLVVMRLSAALLGFVTQHRLGYVCIAPLPVRLWPGKVREPDVMFMSAAHADRIGAYWGVPDLVVEVISPGTERTDREVKRAEYAQAGISEYWIIDPTTRSVERLRLDAGAAAYRLDATLTAGDAVTSPSLPGFSVGLAELFAEP